MSHHFYKKLGAASTWCKKNLDAFDEDTYRALLREHGAKEIQGRISAKSMSSEQMQAAYDHMKKLGYPARSFNSFTAWRENRIKKMYAIWCALHEAEHVKNKNMNAMSSFLEQRLRIKRLAWADSNQINKGVEIMKKWALRVGVKHDQ